MLINKKEILNALKIVIGVTPQKTTQPIINYCLFCFTTNNITMTATDWESAVVLNVPVINGPAESTKNLLLDPVLLNKAIKNVSKKTINLQHLGDAVDVEGTVLQSFGDSDDFPEIPKMNEEVYTYPLQDTFKAAYTFALDASAKEKMRYALCSVFMDFSNGKMVGTDGKRMHIVDFGPRIKEIPSILFYSKSLQQLRPININVPKENEMQPHVFFKIPNGVFSLRLIEGQFPEYKNIIPTPGDTNFEFNRADFISALKKIQQYTTPENSACVITIDKDITISVENKETMGVTTSEIITGKQTGENNMIGINPFYLLDAVSGIDSKRICMNVKNAGSPITLKNIQDSAVFQELFPSKNKPLSFFAIVMPVNIKEI